MTHPTVKEEPFGTLDGRPVTLITLRAGDLTAWISTFGATLTRLQVPDRHGRPGDVVLGFDNLADYRDCPYLGATVGRHANRIAQGRFTLEGQEYQLTRNEGNNHLHGGQRGFDKRLWQARAWADDHEAAVALDYASRDGEEGYPGTLSARVIYSLNPLGELAIEMTATTDRPTVVNLVNHSYWNLAGQGDILGHRLTLQADRYTPVDREKIPTGEILPVAGTPHDFRTPRPIGPSRRELPEGCRGHDTNYVIMGPAGTLRPAALLEEPVSGRCLEVHTTAAGLQFYDGHLLDGSSRGWNDQVHGPCSGLCLETQYFPDGPNQPRFPSPRLLPGQSYRQVTLYRFLSQP